MHRLLELHHRAVASLIALATCSVAVDSFSATACARASVRLPGNSHTFPLSAGGITALVTWQQRRKAHANRHPASQARCARPDARRHIRCGEFLERSDAALAVAALDSTFQKRPLQTATEGHRRAALQRTGVRTADAASPCGASGGCTAIDGTHVARFSLSPVRR